ncbi:MAG: glycine betaine ABC transporter substrate-binding protein [Lentisphaeria bacterium]
MMLKSLSKKVFLGVTLVGTVSLFMMTGCNQGGEEGEGSGEEQVSVAKTADLVYVEWPEGVAYTHLAKVILEEQMGYEVDITSADVGAAYTSVANGDKDAFMETWLPVLHKDYMERYEDDLLDLGSVYEGTKEGLVVPDYVDIDKISELNEHADKFDDEIIGIDAGAGIMKTTKEVIKEYGLDLELVSSSSAAMTAALKDAVDKEEWIVVTGWKPHWKFERWDLKFLEQDEDKEVWGAGKIHIMGRQDLQRDKPELAKFLENMFFSDEQLADLMLAVEEAGSDESIESVVAEWMEDNPDVVDSWIPED